jgi:hypothetical protein
MKLRIQGNSPRFRLTQTEVACLHDSGLVESAVRFPAGRDLRYVIECSPDAIGVSVDYACNSGGLRFPVMKEGLSRLLLSAFEPSLAAAPVRLDVASRGRAIKIRLHPCCRLDTR